MPIINSEKPGLKTRDKDPWHKLWKTVAFLTLNETEYIHIILFRYMNILTMPQKKNPNYIESKMGETQFTPYTYVIKHNYSNYMQI